MAPLDEARGRPRYLIEDATGLIAQSSEAPEPACETAFGPEAPVAQHETWARDMSDVRNIGVAVIGCGYWGPNLVRNFSVCPQTRSRGRV